MTNDAGVPGAPRFDVVFRGYDRRQVDEHMARLQRVIARMRADLSARGPRGPFPGDMPPPGPLRFAAGPPQPRPRPPARSGPGPAGPPPGQSPDMIGGFTDRMQRILQSAEEEAEEIRESARAEGEYTKAQHEELVRQRDAMLTELSQVRSQLEGLLSTQAMRLDRPGTGASAPASPARGPMDGPGPDGSPARRPRPAPPTTARPVTAPAADPVPESVGAVTRTEVSWPPIAALRNRVSAESTVLLARPTASGSSAAPAAPAAAPADTEPPTVPAGPGHADGAQADRSDAAGGTAAAGGNVGDPAVAVDGSAGSAAGGSAGSGATGSGASGSDPDPPTRPAPASGADPAPSEGDPTRPPAARRDPGADTVADPPGEVPPGDVPAGVPAGDVPSGDVPPGDVPPGDVEATVLVPAVRPSVPRARQPSDGEVPVANGKGAPTDANGTDRSASSSRSG